jgi:hypothetical protein
MYLLQRRRCRSVIEALAKNWVRVPAHTHTHTHTHHEKYSLWHFFLFF